MLNYPCISESMNDKLIHSDVVISLPTFIIAECVLIYLDPDSSRTIVGWASQTFSTAIFFLYEQVITFIVSYSTTCFLIERIPFAWYGTFLTDPPRWCFWAADDKEFGGMDANFCSVPWFSDDNLIISYYHCECLISNHNCALHLYYICLIAIPFFSFVILHLCSH